MNPLFEGDDSITTAVIETLGDPREQPKRYNKATLDALIQDGIPSPGTKALENDLARHQTLQYMLQRTDIASIVPAIEEMLVKVFDVKNLGALKEAFGAPVTSDNVLEFAYDVVSELDDNKAQSILAEKAAALNFRYDESSIPRDELIEFLDARINAVLVAKLMEGLNRGVDEQVIDEKACHAITDHAMSDAKSRINPAYIAVLESVFRDAKRSHPDAPIVYLSIGCASGRLDSEICSELNKRIPGLDLKVVGFDPFWEHPERNHIVTQQGGQVINRELEPDETFLDVVKDKLGIEEPVIIATERYALHHMGRTTGRFRKELEGAMLISAEEPVTEKQRTNLYNRLAVSAYDILANYAFETRFGGNWITNARQNPELFGSLYRRLETLQSQTSEGVELQTVPDVYPNTYIITYPPEKKHSLVNESLADGPRRPGDGITSHASHKDAAARPAGGEWTPDR